MEPPSIQNHLKIPSSLVFGVYGLPVFGVYGVLAPVYGVYGTAAVTGVYGVSPPVSGAYGVGAGVDGVGVVDGAGAGVTVRVPRASVTL